MMDISSQLRIILLLIGALVWAAIYYFGKRRAAELEPRPNAWSAETKQVSEPDFLAQDEPVLDEDELDTPAYMRKQPQHETRFDAYGDEFADEPEDQAVAVIEPASAATNYAVHAERDDSALQTIEPVFTHPEADQFQISDMQFSTSPDEPMLAAEPIPESAQSAIEPAVERVESEPEWPHQTEVPTIPAVSIVVEPPASQLRSGGERSTQTSSTAPTLSEAVTPPAANTASQKPVSRDDKVSSPAARRKIIALRLAMPERVPGAQLQALLHSERLVHGRFNIFHRVHGNGTVFSLASMVEPGTFDLETMAQQQFPGVTLFMLLPGPLDGLIAYDQMLSCAQRLAHATGGVLQDERGNKLTTQFMERLREEVLDFQHLIGGMAVS